METIRNIADKVVEDYKKNLNKKVVLVDALIAFSFFTGIIQVTSFFNLYFLL